LLGRWRAVADRPAPSSAADWPKPDLEAFLGGVFWGRELVSGGQKTIELRASLDADAPNECQGATWALTYTAAARRA